MKLHYSLSELGNLDLTPFIPIVIICFIITIIALIDLIVHRKTRKNVMIWAVVILITNVVGSILYFVLGRKE